jgi:hypothetical protein
MGCRTKLLQRRNVVLAQIHVILTLFVIQAKPAVTATVVIRTVGLVSMMNQVSKLAASIWLPMTLDVILTRLVVLADGLYGPITKTVLRVLPVHQAVVEHLIIPAHSTKQGHVETL